MRLRKKAVAVLDELRHTIPYDVYCTIYDGLTDIETLKDRDVELEELWDKFADTPMNPETDCIEEPFMHWDIGTHKEEIWHWFDKQHSKGVYYLLYGINEVKANKVYELMVNWSANYETGCQTIIYRTKSTAIKAMNTEIVSAMQDYDVFDGASGELVDNNWTLEKTDSSWELYENGNWICNHCLITITEKTIIEEEEK